MGCLDGRQVLSFAHSDWESCVCSDISLVVIVVDGCSETEDSSTSPFDPFPCMCWIFTGGVTPLGTVVIGFGLSTDYFPVGKWLWGHWNKSHTLHDILWITIHATSSQIIVVTVTVTVLSSCKEEALSLDLLEFLLHLGLLLFIPPLQLISDDPDSLLVVCLKS